MSGKDVKNNSIITSTFAFVSSCCRNICTWLECARCVCLLQIKTWAQPLGAGEGVWTPQNLDGPKFLHSFMMNRV